MGAGYCSLYHKIYYIKVRYIKVWVYVHTQFTIFWCWETIPYLNCYVGVILFKEIPIFCASKNLVKIVGHTMITYLAKDDDVKRISKILMTVVVFRETDDLKWSGSDHDLDHYLARKDRIMAHIFEKGKDRIGLIFSENQWSRSDHFRSFFQIKRIDFLQRISVNYVEAKVEVENLSNIWFCDM